MYTGQANIPEGNKETLLLPSILWKKYIYSHSTIPHVVVFLKESVVLHCPLLKLQVYAAAIDADNAPDPAAMQVDERRERET